MIRACASIPAIEAVFCRADFLPEFARFAEKRHDGQYAPGVSQETFRTRPGQLQVQTP
jgi:hypothetical protein